MAMSPAMPEQIVCEKDEIVIATVLSAGRNLCSLEEEARDPVICGVSLKGVNLQLKINKVIAQRVGDVSVAGATMRPVEPGEIYTGRMIGRIPLSRAEEQEESNWFREILRRTGKIPNPTETNERADTVIDKNLVGKQAIFSFYFSPSDSVAHIADAWPLESESWVRNILTEKNIGYICPKLVD